MDYNEAMLILYENFKIIKGVIEKKKNSGNTTKEENEALDVLFHEYDFTYRGEL